MDHAYVQGKLREARALVDEAVATLDVAELDPCTCGRKKHRAWPEARLAEKMKNLIESIRTVEDHAARSAREMALRAAAE